MGRFALPGVMGFLSMRNDYEPPVIDPTKLDFSQFHPLMHKLGSSECRSYYGGAFQHLKLLWWYKWEIPTKIRRQTRCRFGRHEYAPWFRGPRDPETGRLQYGGRLCCYCRQDMPESLPD